MSQFQLFPTWDREIFVFGSNLRGRHEAGAALTAAARYGASPGHYEGIMERCYAIPTKDEYMKPLPLNVIKASVEEFIAFATHNERMRFNVTSIGCGFAGYRPKEIAPMFGQALYMENVYLPFGFLKILVVDPHSHRLSFNQ
jgi:hypothetical protein